MTETNEFAEVTEETVEEVKVPEVTIAEILAGGDGSLKGSISVCIDAMYSLLDTAGSLDTGDGLLTKKAITIASGKVRAGVMDTAKAMKFIRPMALDLAKVRAEGIGGVQAAAKRESLDDQIKALMEKRDAMIEAEGLEA